MKVIGLTGSFGTGKTFVASIFRALGAAVLDADELAHEALKRGEPPCRKVVRRFGSSVLGRGKGIDRKALAEIVFKDRRSLEALCRIVHPVVIKRIKEEVRKEKGRASVVVIDAPLLVEANLAGMVDALVVVKASLENQVKRCRAKFGLKRGEVLRRVRNQLPLKEKLKMADFIIDNNGTREKTRKQVKEIWMKLTKTEGL